MTRKPKLVSSNNGLVIKNIRKTLSRKQIVRDVSLKLKRGNTVGLLGPNGAGKTTTFYMIMGLLDCDGGEIMLDDKDLTNLPMYKRARMGLGFLPQQPSIFRGMSVEDNLLSILELQKYPKDQKQNILEDLLTEFSLTHLRRAMPHMLSGGERRRTEIARALASSPKFLLLDEPFAGIDPIAIEEVKSTISILKKMKIGIIITDHNVKEALSIVDYGYIIYNGEIIKSGSPNDIISDKFVKKISDNQFSILPIQGKGSPIGPRTKRQCRHRCAVQKGRSPRAAPRSPTRPPCFQSVRHPSRHLCTGSILGATVMPAACERAQQVLACRSGAYRQSPEQL